MYEAGHKYSYPFYYSGKRTVEVETSSGTIQTPAEPEEPIKSNMPYMIVHPFVSLANILDLINDANELTVDFDDVNTALSNVG